MEKSKGETFIGFAVRARKCKIGFNACTTLKRANLLVICFSASENTVKDVKKLAAKFNCPLYKTVQKPLEDMTHKSNAKVMAITDVALADAVKNNLGDDFIEIK